MVDVKKHSSKQLKMTVLLTVAALFAVGGVYFWINQNKKPAAPATAAQTDTKYLVITDWGIKFPLTENSQDAGYSNRIASPIARTLNARFLNKDSGCTDQPAAIIYRVKPDELNPQAKGKTYVQSETGKTVDTYFYFVRNGPQTCTKPEDQARLDKVRAEFLGIAPSIEKQ